MEYSKIISVTGLGGLYELIGSKADGAIVRSLDDNTTKFISSRNHQFTHLESVEIYTTQENVNLVEILNAIKNSTEKLPDHKDADAVKKYFTKVYPTMDFERVYASDMKKMIRWFDILDANKIDFSIKIEEETKAEIEVAEATEEVTEKKSAPKKAAKKKEVPADEVADATKKKAAPKKKKTEE